MSPAAEAPNVELLAHLARHGQEHLLAGWEHLDTATRSTLVRTLSEIDLTALARLHALRDAPACLPDLSQACAPTIQSGEPNGVMETLGSVAIASGRVAVVLVAGGQSSRLGVSLPKGVFPVTPVTGKSLFQVHAEKLVTLGRRHEVTPPLFVMTSPATDSATRDFFAAHGNFGLPTVTFFQQGTMPSVEIATGKILLEAPGKPFLAPDGHGGCLSALEKQGHLAWMQDRGIRTVFYFQVDNPLVRVAEPSFIGRHLRAESQASSKVVPRRFPGEKLGVFVSLADRCHVVEYSDLPPDLSTERLADGSLRYAAGSPAIHLFSVDFLRQVAATGYGADDPSTDKLPFHIARKKVPHVDPATGSMITPTAENALKFERFIFDALPRAERWLLVGALHEEEFAPLKNAEGPDSPQTVKLAQSRLAAGWLAHAGVKVPTDGQGNPPAPVEISPLVALEPGHLRGLYLPEWVEGKPYLLDEAYELRG